MDTSDLSNQNIASLLIEFTREFIFLQPKAMIALALRVQRQPMTFSAEEVALLMQCAPLVTLPPQLVECLLKRASEIPADFTVSQITSSLRALLEANFEIPYPLFKVWCAECDHQAKKVGAKEVADMMWVLMRCNDEDELLLQSLRKQVRLVYQDFNARQLVETLIVLATHNTKEDRETSRGLINAALDKTSQLDVALTAGVIWACDKLSYPHLTLVKAKLRSVI